tara:strand:- start:1403 stop:2590 length:1188 start_codon:yes stop_codon:yes gene_type:complete
VTVKKSTAPTEAPTDAGWRTDRQVLLRKPRSNGAGGLLLDAFISKPGVLIYKRADGSEIRELVPSETLHAAASLDSLRMTPVTVDHPRDGTVTAQNYQNLAVGMVGERVDISEDGLVRMVLNVASERGVKAIEGRLDNSERRQEVSAGYFVRVDETPGEHHEYGVYDRTQIERVYNHIALVHAGRAGSSVRVRADEAHRPLDDAPGQGDDDMELKEQLAAAQAEAAAFKARLDAMEADKSVALRADFDALLLRVDTLAEEFAAATAAPSDEEAEAAAEASAKARCDDREFRRRLDGLLPAAKLEAPAADKLATVDLVEAVFTGLGLTEIKLDGVDETACRKAAVVFHLDAKPAAHPYELSHTPRMGVKETVEDAAKRLDALFDVRKPHPDEDAQA